MSSRLFSESVSGYFWKGFKILSHLLLDFKQSTLKMYFNGMFSYSCIQ